MDVVAGIFLRKEIVREGIRIPFRVYRQVHLADVEILVTVEEKGMRNNFVDG